jgi:iron(III) transport system permease protein
MAVTPSVIVSRARAARRHDSTGWWIAACVALVPGLVPPISLAIQVLTRGSGLNLPIPRLVELMVNTLVLTVAVTTTAVVTGLFTAWLTTRTDIPARRTWVMLVALPLVVPSYMAALTLIGATGPAGLLDSIGLDVPTPYGFVGAWLTLSVFLTPMAHLMIVPGLRSVDVAMEEAARGLGAGPGTVLRTITLPQLRPAIVSAALLVALYTVSDFGAVSLLRFDTFTRAIYILHAGQIDRRPAAALSLALMIVALGLLLIERRTRRRGGYATATPRRNRRLVSLHGWKRPLALSFLGAYVSIALILPAAVLVYWVARGVGSGNEIGRIWDEVGRTLAISIGAALITVIAAVPVAIVTTWRHARPSPVVEGASWVAYSLPHIAVGVAVVSFVLRAAPILYQTVTLLLLVYLGMFLAQAMAPIQDSLRRTSLDLEAASRGLGRGQMQTLRRVTLPIITPGLMAGCALVFISTMKELPATLLLRPNEFETLAIRIWSATGEGFYTQASAASLALIIVSIVPLLLMTRRDLATT